MSHVEIEKQRLADLSEIEAEDRAKFSPGSFGCHEALHSTSIFMDGVARNLLEHPAIVSDAEFYRLASEAHKTLFDLYQAIGTKHLDAPPLKRRT